MFKSSICRVQFRKIERPDRSRATARMNRGVTPGHKRRIALRPTEGTSLVQSFAKPGLLMLSRRFAPLFWCQFFSAFNDNFLKQSLVLLILFHVTGSQGAAMITLAGAVFIGPYFLLSALGG